MKYILSSTINLSEANTGKLQTLSAITQDYKKSVEYYINLLWSGKFDGFYWNKDGVFDLAGHEFTVRDVKKLDLSS